MLIYTPKTTSRIEYSFHLIFDTIWKIEYQITEDIEFFISHKGAKFNYSNKKLEDECFIKAYGLLSEKGISDQELNFDIWCELPIFFKVKDSFLPFDVFSASFYLVSRY